MLGTWGSQRCLVWNCTVFIESGLSTPLVLVNATGSGTRAVPPGCTTQGNALWCCAPES